MGSDELGGGGGGGRLRNYQASFFMLRKLDSHFLAHCVFMIAFDIRRKSASFIVSEMTQSIEFNTKILFL